MPQKKLVVKDYSKVFNQLKQDIQKTQLAAATAVTKQLIFMYLRIGKILSKKTQQDGWGAKTLERLTKDLKKAFPDLKGFSVRNLQYMRKFAENCPDDNYAAAAAQIPWGHNILLLDKLPEDWEQRIWYIQQTIEGGWSRSTLGSWIDSSLYTRQGKALSNFQSTLPVPQSDLAEQLLKDPYNLDFLTLSTAHKEKELEQGLMDHLQKFLVELGEGFAFMGRQVPLEIAEEDHFLDLLFYHVKLRCYVVIELKATAFDPRDAGQMNFYLSAVDDLLRHPDDQPTIGILLCKKKNKIKAEYALRDLRKPIGIASYETKILKNLPKQFTSSLPTIEEIEAELADVTQSNR